MDLFFGEYRARSACTYVQADLALHSPLFYHYSLSLSMKPYPMPFNQVKYVCETVYKVGKISLTVHLRRMKFVEQISGIILNNFLEVK